MGILVDLKGNDISVEEETPPTGEIDIPTEEAEAPPAEELELLSIRLNTGNNNIGIYMPNKPVVPYIALVQILMQVIEKELAPLAQKEVDSQKIVKASEADLKRLEQLNGIRK